MDGADDAREKVATTSSRLSKKQRGRLKKLRKRALEVKEGCESTGIANVSDRNQLIELASADSTKGVGPAVRPRRQNHYKGSDNTEGIDHRDILYQVLQRTNTSKKRGGQEITANIPAWATLHNVGFVQSLVVVELNIDKIDCDLDDLLSRIPILTQLKKNQEENSCSSLQLKTRWFQGHRLKSVADSLLYFNVSSVGSSNKKRKGSNDSTSTAHVVETLKKLMLSKVQRTSEGYPIKLQKSTEKSGKSPPRIPPTCLPTLDEARWVLEGRCVSLLSQEEDNDENDENYVATVDVGETRSRVFAVDCEMVKSSSGIELARVTLVQLDSVDPMQHTVVLDELVKPDRPVLDYVTQYSGITAAILNPVKTKLEQIQAFVIQLLNSSDILVGHSLENDLRAMRMVHDRVVDTAVLFRGNNGRKFSLRHLTASLLKRTIQADEKGHCSEEDAVASLELAIRRAQEGPSFRIHASNETMTHLFECLRFDRNQPIVFIGPSAWLKRHVTPFESSAHALACETIEDSNRKALSAWLVNEKRRAKLVWANLVASEALLDTINEAITDLLQRALPGTLCLIAFQKGHNNANAVAEERQARKNPRSSLGWTTVDERNWNELTDKTRSGYAFWVGTKRRGASDEL